MSEFSGCLQLISSAHVICGTSSWHYSSCMKNSYLIRSFYMYQSLLSFYNVECGVGLWQSYHQEWGRVRLSQRATACIWGSQNLLERITQQKLRENFLILNAVCVLHTECIQYSATLSLFIKYFSLLSRLLWLAG